LWSLLQDFWAQFHKVWGQARDGEYDKRAWSKLQDDAHALFRRLGIERRAAPRTPGDL
jgi:hypothetical protein